MTPNYEERRDRSVKKNYLSDREVVEPHVTKAKINSLILSEDEEANFNK